MSTETIILLILGALICEFIDSYLGMMYGTILSPLLIIIGFDPKIVVPSLLLSQALGGFIASLRHHKFKNASFNIKSKDFKVASVIVGLGILAIVFGVSVGVKIPAVWLKTYIGVLCLFMGIWVLLKRKFKFSWVKIMILGIISSFNKAFSGGGFGPLVASGQVVSGRNGKESIGTTDFAEAPICLLSFLTWIIMMHKIPDLGLLIPLCIGAIIGGFFGPLALSRFESRRKLMLVIALLVITESVWALLQTWVF